MLQASVWGQSPISSTWETNREPGAEVTLFLFTRESSCLSRLTAHSSEFNGAASLRGSSTVLQKHIWIKSGHKTSIRAALPVVSGIPVLGPLANLVLNPVLLVALYAIGG